MSRAVKLLLVIVLLAVATWVLLYPQHLLSPGKLIGGHENLEADCFACHAPLRGAQSGRCIDCHALADIGRVTTTGDAIANPTPFHQKLLKQDCMACHSDHAGVQRFRPQGRFSHELLQPGTRQQCQSCHRSPDDSLHRRISGNCSFCHSQEKWKPATFDHDEYFMLDRDHDVRCTTCHNGKDFSRYTCYGCHEHSPAGIRREHVEEGIRDFGNCVECHRSADEHDIRGSFGKNEHERKRQRGERDDD